MSGKLYGVGVGPGDPKLMTYLAVETIKNCEGDKTGCCDRN